jgi:hypothetical protein
MEDAEFRQYVHATQQMVGQLHELVGQLNATLGGVQSALTATGAVATQQIELAASAYDMAYLAVRAMADMSPDFRTVLLRIAQEPAIIEAAQGHRDALREALAGAHRALGERPRLRPVPPDADA